MVTWTIPATGHERHIWHVADDVYVSRSHRARGSGEYESAVPIRLADLDFAMLMERASVRDLTAGE